MMNILWILLGASAITESGLALPTEGNKPTFSPMPQGSPDGFYMGTLNEDGSTDWTSLNVTASPGNFSSNPSTLSMRSDTASFEKRAATGAYCTGFALDPFYINAVADGFAQQCGGGYDFINVLTYQVAQTIAYGCNYGNGQTCHTSDVSTFFASIQSECGPQSGWWSQNNWKASYGYTDVSQGYC